jgi:tRNA (guanine-N7-)-methyltransferase
MQLAQEHPEINYIGIEKYSSVLLRCLEKQQELEQLYAMAIPRAAGQDASESAGKTYVDSWLVARGTW